MQKKIIQYTIDDEKSLDTIDISLSPGDRIFFYGDLGVGKTTLIRYILKKHTSNEGLIVRSPTYTYYEQYNNIFHFDLYRIEDTAVFFDIGGMEIADNNETIMLIEWPEIIAAFVEPTHIISIKKVDSTKRLISVESYSLSTD